MQTYQILTNDDEVCIPSLSSILLAVPRKYPSKNEQMYSTLLLWYLRSTCFRSFLEEIEDTKKTFRN